ALVAALVPVTTQAAGPPPGGPGQGPDHRTADLPVFTSTGAIVDPLDETLPHNPNQEFIFPSVFHAGAHLAEPLGEWYVYYAPHDDPGGINLMYADSLDGPWTQYEGSPVVDNRWEGVYDVPHVSSPDAVWNPDERQMNLYFHGDTRVTTTRRRPTASRSSTAARRSPPRWSTPPSPAAARPRRPTRGCSRTLTGPRHSAGRCCS